MDLVKEEEEGTFGISRMLSNFRANAENVCRFLRELLIMLEYTGRFQ